MAEFIQGKPIFPGKTEPEQIKLIFKVKYNSVLFLHLLGAWNPWRRKMARILRASSCEKGTGWIFAKNFSEIFLKFFENFSQFFNPERSTGRGIRIINCERGSKTKSQKLAMIWWKGTYIFLFYSLAVWNFCRYFHFELDKNGQFCVIKI